MRFRYEAKDRNAVYRSGVIEAFDRHEAQQKLVQLGLFVISLDMDVPKNVVLVGEQNDPVAAAGSRNLGIWLIIYDLLWLNVIGFIAYFGLALAIGDSAVPVGILVNGFLIAGTAAAIAANSFLIGAGIGFITGKEWARKCALIGTVGVFIFAFSLLCVAIFYRAVTMLDRFLFALVWFFMIAPATIIARKTFQTPAARKSRIPLAISLTSVLAIVFVLGSYALNEHYRAQASRKLAQESVSVQDEAAEGEQPADLKPSEEGPLPTPFAGSRRPTTTESLEIARELEEEASNYQQQEKYRQALSLYQQALYIKKNLLGSAHPEVLVLLDTEEKLRTMLASQGIDTEGPGQAGAAADFADELYAEARKHLSEKNYQEAERLLKQVLKIKEDKVGAADPSLEEVCRDLAELYERSGRVSDAETFYKRLIGFQEERLQADDPLIGDSLQHLGNLYIAQGNFAGASPLVARALEIRKIKNGEDSLEAAESMQALADCYFALGNYAGAFPLSKTAAEIRERALGPFDVTLSDSLDRLASINLITKKYQDAEALLKRVLMIREDAFGRDSPKLIPTLNKLAAIFRKNGDLQDAEAFYRRSLNIKEGSSQEPSAELAGILLDLGTLYRDKKRVSEAKVLLKRALEMRRGILPPGDTRITEAVVALAGVYAIEDDAAGGIPLFKEALDAYEKTLGEASPQVIECLNELARLHALKGDFAEAESLLIRVLTIIERSAFPGDPRLTSAYKKLAEFYLEIGEVSKAKYYEEKLEE